MNHDGSRLHEILSNEFKELDLYCVGHDQLLTADSNPNFREFSYTYNFRKPLSQATRQPDNQDINALFLPAGGQLIMKWPSTFSETLVSSHATSPVMGDGTINNSDAGLCDTSIETCETGGRSQSIAFGSCLPYGPVHYSDGLIQESPHGFKLEEGVPSSLTSSSKQTHSGSCELSETITRSGTLYYCHLCSHSPSFINAKNLSRHQATTKAHRNPDSPSYRCTCGFAWFRKDHVQRHLKSCTDQAGLPYSCICGMNFINGIEYRKHVKLCGRKRRYR